MQHATSKHQENNFLFIRKCFLHFSQLCLFYIKFGILFFPFFFLREPGFGDDSHNFPKLPCHASDQINGGKKDLPYDPIDLLSLLILVWSQGRVNNGDRLKQILSMGEKYIVIGYWICFLLHYTQTYCSYVAKMLGWHLTIISIWIHRTYAGKIYIAVVRRYASN